MGISVTGTAWAMVLILGLLGTIVWSLRRKAYSSLSRREIALTILPGIVMTGTFYALAVHMHAELGGWPKTIGEAGFPPVLVTHRNGRPGIDLSALRA